MPYVEFTIDNEQGQQIKSPTPVKVGCVLSGGQAPGGHNVISGLYDMVKRIHPDSKLYGFLKGPRGIFTGNFMEIEKDYMDMYRNMGGFDMIMSGRDKIETDEQLRNSFKYCKNLGLDGLVVIGGDDSNTNACLLAEYFKANGAKCQVVGAPKTIDGDLKNEHCEVSFGFDTSTKSYAEAIGNILVDHRSTKNYYHFIRLMGRSASHIALECYLQCRPNYVLIGEEILHEKKSLIQVTKELTEIVVKRCKMGKNYGTILVPEGVIEFFPEIGSLISEINDILADIPEEEKNIKEYVEGKLTPEGLENFQFLPLQIQHQLLLDRDAHGNVSVSQIETESLLILLIKEQLTQLKEKGEYEGTFTPVSHFYGYEGRCALPSDFDAQYCYTIGRNAACLIKLGYSGYMSTIKNLKDDDPANWICSGTPLPSMIGMEKRKGKMKPVITKYLVDLNGDCYKAYKQFRDAWAMYDCYRSPGPVQFHNPTSLDTPYLVKPPSLEKLEEETNQRIEYENKQMPIASEPYFRVCKANLSKTAEEMISYQPELPEFLQENDYACFAVKTA